MTRRDYYNVCLIVLGVLKVTVLIAGIGAFAYALSL